MLIKKDPYFEKQIRLHFDKEVTKELISTLKKITGVTYVHDIDRYSVEVVKGVLFSWEDIKHEIIVTVAEFFDESEDVAPPEQPNTNLKPDILTDELPNSYKEYIFNRNFDKEIQRTI